MSKFSAGIIWREVDHNIFQLVQPTVTLKRRFPRAYHIKYPGGNAYRNESREDALRREIRQELWVEFVGEPELIFERTIVERSHVHTVSFFGIEFGQLVGEIREIPWLDHDSLLLPPCWPTVEEASRVLNLPNHLEAHLAFVRKKMGYHLG